MAKMHAACSHLPHNVLHSPSHSTFSYMILINVGYIPFLLPLPWLQLFSEGLEALLCNGELVLERATLVLLRVLVKCNSHGARDIQH